MHNDGLLFTAIAVFTLLIIGLALTIFEFHYYILNDKDYKKNKKSKKSKILNRDKK